MVCEMVRPRVREAEKFIVEPVRNSLLGVKGKYSVVAYTVDADWIVTSYPRLTEALEHAENLSVQNKGSGIFYAVVDPNGKQIKVFKC